MLHFTCQHEYVLSCFSCIWLFATLWTVGCRTPGSSLHGILQARILEGGWYSILQGIFPTQALILHLFSLVQSLSRVGLFVISWTAAHQAPWSNTNSWSLLNSCPLSRWCHPAISSCVILFSFCLRSFPESGSFQMSQFFASGGQSIGVSVSGSVLPMNIQDWFPLKLTGLISL